MWKALLKKQFLELNRFYFQRGSGKRRSSRMTMIFIALMVFAAFSVAMAFFGMSEMFSEALLPLKQDWLYFALMGLVALFISTIINSFQTFSSLYVAKDNEFLLSLPIPPSKILAVRMIGAYGMGLLYESLAFVPAMIVYWIKVPPTAATIVLPILLLFVLAFLALVLTCVVGFVIAVIATRVKNKSVISVLVGILLILVYYFCYFRMNAFLASVVTNAVQIGEGIQTYALPFYYMGMAASGDGLSFLWFTLIVAGLFALTYWILSISFVRIATTNRGGKQAKYHEKGFKRSTVRATLLRKEFRRFTQSAAYMLNSGLGILFLLGVSVFAIVRMGDVDMLKQTLASDEAPDWVLPFLPVAIAGILCLLGGMCQISAPSISLEGKNLWVLRSSPVDAWEVLNAKQTMHFLLVGIPSAIAAVVMAILFGVPFWMGICMVLLVVLCTAFSAKFGLMLGIKNPNFEWKNETVPIKQSAAVGIGMLVGFLLPIVLTAPYFLLYEFCSTEVYFVAEIVVVGAMVYGLDRWLKTKGVTLFNAL